MNDNYHYIILIVFKLIHANKKLICDISLVKNILMKLKKAYPYKESPLTHKLLSQVYLYLFSGF